MTATYDENFLAYSTESSRYAAGVVVRLVCSGLSPESILDVGCAEGGWLSVWHRQGVPEVHGIDGDYVARDRLMIPVPNFTAGDLSRPFDLGRTFDLVLAHDAIDYMLSEDDLRAAFDTAWRQVMDLDLYARVLLGGGTILVDRTPVYAYRRHAGTTTSKNTAAYVRLGEETALARRTADEAAGRGWRRARRAARMRWTTRLNGVLCVMTDRSTPRDVRRRAWRDITGP